MKDLKMPQQKLIIVPDILKLKRLERLELTNITNNITEYVSPILNLIDKKSKITHLKI